jgi:cytochrome b involved in lipid metabolism
MSQTFTTADVAKHNKGDDLFIIVDDDVYDLTTFQDEHPGGKKSMINPRTVDPQPPLIFY